MGSGPSEQQQPTTEWGYEEHHHTPLKHKHQYPYIDKGELAMLRGKPKNTQQIEQKKYIDQMAAKMIKNAGKKCEAFIKEQVKKKRI